MVGASGNKGGVFVTVGTTKFDALVEAVDSIHVAEALISRGYRSLVIQVCSQGRNKPLAHGKPSSIIPMHWIVKWI